MNMASESLFLFWYTFFSNNIGQNGLFEAFYGQAEVSKNLYTVFAHQSHNKHYDAHEN
jgi:hypothetical protein